jgi:hypothetical protein
MTHLEQQKAKYTPQIVDILAYQAVITAQGSAYTGEKDWALNKILALIEATHKSAIEECVRVAESRRPDYPMGKHAGKSFCPQCEDLGAYNALTDLITTLRAQVSEGDKK